jgi:hypothetical protein
MILLRLFCPNKGLIEGYYNSHAHESMTNGKISPNPYPNPELKASIKSLSFHCSWEIYVSRLHYATLAAAFSNPNKSA